MIPNIRFIQNLAACGALALLAGCSTGGPSGGSLAKLDADHNGAGSRAEFDAFMKREVFTRADASGDSKVTLQEWQSVNPTVDAAKFRKADSNRDGGITRAEADAAFDREGSLNRLFTWVDADGSGGLSQAEINDFRSGLRQQPGVTPIQKLSNAAAKP